MKNSNMKIAARSLLASAALLAFATAALAQEVSLSTTIKNKQFQPSTLHAPANKPIKITVHNADSTAAEFESRTMRVEKIVPAGGTITVNVKPLVPGNYGFFDDFNQANQGTLVVQ